MKSTQFFTMAIATTLTLCSYNHAAVIPLEQLSTRAKSKTEMIEDITTHAPDLLPFYQKQPDNEPVLDLIHTIAMSKTPIVVKFYSNYCGPCRSLAPVVKTVSNQLDTKALFIEIDTSTYRAFASVFEFRFIPTLIFFNKGTEVERSNSLSEEQLRQKVEALI